MPPRITHPKPCLAPAHAAFVVAAAPRKTRPFAILAVVSLALLMSSLDQTIVATALDALQQGLDTSVTWASWTITIYSLGLILMLPVAGKLSERFGRRRVFLASVGVFAGASLCCGLAPNIYVLIALRFVQAIGGAGFTPAATGIIVDHFGHGRDKALGMFGSIFSVGAMIGPIFGGLFVAYGSWRGIFFVNVPITVLLGVLCLYFVPADPPMTDAPRERFDFGGLVTLGIGMLGLMATFSAMGEGGGVFEPAAIVPAIVAAAAFTAFARHTVHSSHPFIRARFLAGRGFGAVNIINVMGGMVIGLVALVPLYAATRYHIPALASGTLLTAEGAAFIVVSTIATMALRHSGYRLPVAAGTGVIMLGIVALAVNPGWMSPYAWLVVATSIVGAGAGLSSPATRNAGLQLAPQNAPTLAALRTLCFQIGSIASIAVTTAVIASAGHASSGHVYSYVGWVVVLLVLSPIIARIPEHHGAW